MSCKAISQNIWKGINILERASEELADFSRPIREGQRSRGHYFWVIPASVALNLTKMVLAPVIALANLLAAAIFGLMSLCVGSWSKVVVQTFLLMSVRNVTDGLYTSFDRLFFPSTEPSTCVSKPLAKCLLECIV